MTSNTTLSLNVDDTFIAQCKGAANQVYSDTHYIDFYLTKSAPATIDSISFPSGSTSGNLPTVSLSSGTFVYNTFEGNAEGFEHWYVNPYINQVSGTTDFPFILTHITIPRLSTIDAGTYYCAFYDASGASYSTSTFAFSAGLTLMVNTKTSGARSSMAGSKMAGYSLALFSAYKFLI